MYRQKEEKDGIPWTHPQTICITTLTWAPSEKGEVQSRWQSWSDVYATEQAVFLPILQL